MVMLLNDTQVSGIEANLDKKTGLSTIEFFADIKQSKVIGKLKLDRHKTWTLICHLMRNYSAYYLPSMKCANCEELKPAQEVKCLCNKCVSEAK